MVIQNMGQVGPIVLAMPVMGFGLMAAFIGSSIISIGSSFLGARAQRKANKKARQSLERIEAQKLGLSREQFEFSKKLIAEGKPIRDALRDAGLKTIPALTETSLLALGGIQEDLARAPGTGETVARSFRGLFQNLGAFGLADSSAAGVGAGEIVSRDIDSIRQLRLGAASLAPGPGESTLPAGVNIAGQATNLNQQAGNIGAIRSQLLTRSPTAGLFSDLSSAASAFATSSALNSFSSGGSSLPAGRRASSRGGGLVNLPGGL